MLAPPLGSLGYTVVDNSVAFDANVVGPAAIAAWNTTALGPTREPTSQGGALWTYGATGIIAPVDGDYEVVVQVAVDGSSAARGNFGLRILVNGIAVGAEGQMDYIRVSGGHDDSSNIAHAIVSALAGQVIGAQTRRLSTTAVAMTCAIGRAFLSVKQLRGIGP